MTMQSSADHTEADRFHPIGFSKISKLNLPALRGRYACKTRLKNELEEM